MAIAKPVFGLWFLVLDILKSAQVRETHAKLLITDTVAFVSLASLLVAKTFQFLKEFYR